MLTESANAIVRSFQNPSNMDNTRNYPVKETSYELICKIDEVVIEAKQDDDWRRAYVTYQVMRRDMELKGISKGKILGAIENYRADGIYDAAINESLSVVFRRSETIYG